MIDLVSLESLSPEALEHFMAGLEDSLDVLIGDARNASDTLAVFSEKIAYWVITVEEIPVGLFGLNLTILFPDEYQTTTLILKEWRGKGIGPVIKQAVVQSFVARHMPLISCVREWNKPSFRSISRAFPEIKPELHLMHPNATDSEPYNLYVFDLSKATVEEVPEIGQKVVNVVSSWLRVHKNFN